MFGYQVKEDRKGIYYIITYDGRTTYIHSFSFPNKEEAQVAAFNHVLLRAYWSKIIGKPEHYL